MPKSTVSKVIVAVAIIIAMTAILTSCLRSPAASESFQGWIEGQFVFVGPDETGRVEKLGVREGDTVKKGDHLFSLDAALQADNLAEAEAALVNARIAFGRAKNLLEKRVGTEKAFDEAQAAFRAAKAHRDSAKTRLARRRIFSPATGSVQEVYFRIGEMVQSARPVVSILPPDDVRVRFFVPQAVLARLKIGTAVSISCDGCKQTVSAKISFISTEAEFTPPVIYSPEERSRLVFRVEAQLEEPKALKVGQPVTVILASGD